MEAEDHNAQHIGSVFGEKSLYEILEVSPTSTEQDIKKAYRKLALQFHPDKGGDGKTFQALSMVHSILSDPEKRKLYDETGDVDAQENSNDFDFWYEYFRNLFPKLTTKSIDDFSQQYKGSGEEIDDIVAAYEKHAGDMRKILEVVMLAEEGDECRICGVIDSAITKGRIVTLPQYEATRVKAGGTGSKKRTAKAKREEKELEELAQMIQNKNSKKDSGIAGASSKSSAFARIFAKYGGAAMGDDGGDVSDAAFEATQKKLLARQKRQDREDKSGKTSKKTKKA